MPGRVRNFRRTGTMDFQGTPFDFNEHFRQHYSDAVRRDHVKRRRAAAEAAQREEDDPYTFWIIAAALASIVWIFQ